MSTTHAPARSRSKRLSGSVQGTRTSAAPSHAQGAAGLHALSGAGPVFGLGGVQRQVAIGKAGGAPEREADAAAGKIAAGKSVEPGDISTIEPGAIAQSQMAEKEPEGAVQKAEAKPEQKVEDKQPVQKAEASEPEEKRPVQKAEDAQPEEKRPVQKAEAPQGPEKRPDAMPVQKAQDKPEQKIEDKQPVQKEAAGPAPSAGTGMAAAAGRAIDSKGAGRPLEPATRSRIESGLGVDLGHVRVHDDARARQAASDINARAFTHGSDIWLGPGASQQDTRLMAHEATHVVQQAGGVQRMVQRAGGGGQSSAPAVGAAPAAPLTSPAGTIDVANKKMSLPELKIPAFKHGYMTKTDNVTIQKGGTERPGGSESQRTIWTNTIGTAVEGAAKTKLQALKGIRKNSPGQQDTGIAEDPTNSPNKILFLPLKGGQVSRRRRQVAQKDSYLIGSPDELKSELVIPRWDSKGQPRAMDVDHKVELQLGGENKIENMNLLDASANRSSGSRINNSILKTIAEAVKPQVGKPPFKKAPKRAEQSALKAQYEITYQKISPDAGMDHPDKDARWEKEEVEQVDKPLAAITPPLTAAQVTAKHLLGDPTRLVLYPLSSGGAPKDISWDATNQAPDGNPDWNKLGFRGLANPGISYDEGKRTGKITGTWPAHKKKKSKVVPKPIEMPLLGVGDFPYTCRLDKGGLLQSMRYAELYALSRAELDSVEMDEAHGLSARGKLAPSLPFFKKLDIDIVIDSDGVSLEKTFTKTDFKLPGPIQVTDANLTVLLGEGGLEVGGSISIEIPRLGTGTISGRIGRNGELELTGSIDFDSKLFDPASVTVTYAGGRFSGSGQIGVPAGKVKGVKSARITASFSDEEIKATGTITPDIPAVEQGEMSLEYKKEAGLTIGGKLTLKKDIPGIEGGSMEAQVTKKPGVERYIVKASGKATPKIPGISSELSVSYDDGMFDASVTAGYEKGRLKGTLTAGATNRPVGDKGKPSGGAPEGKGDKIVFYGGGSLSLKLSPWLQATAGVMFKPNGEIQISGEIGLPEALNIFPEKKLDKNLFKIGVDIPIVGVAVAGQRIGIFANITGGLDLSAGIGPGQLQALKMKVDYNPAHEDQTHVQGDARLHVPAHAGLRLFVRGGLGVGIPIVSAQAGIEVGGQLGLSGALDTGVHVDWTPTKGLVLDANAEIYVEPKLKFDVTGFVLVEADLWITTIELYNKRWQLAGFEWGSGLRFGVSFPVHYEEGKELNLSLDNVKFQVPDIKPKAVLSDLMKKIA
jgi:hypothetical protein